MAKSSNYMMALFGVLAGNMRRGKTYFQQQALVSKIYPYFLPPELVIGSASFADGAMDEIVIFHTISPELLAGSVSFDGAMSEIVKTIAFSETITGESIFAAGLIPSKAVENYIDNLVGSTEFADPEMPALAYIPEPETVVGTSTFFGGELT